MSGDTVPDSWLRLRAGHHTGVVCASIPKAALTCPPPSPLPCLASPAFPSQASAGSRAYTNRRQGKENVGTLSGVHWYGGVACELGRAGASWRVLASAWCKHQYKKIPNNKSRKREEKMQKEKKGGMTAFLSHKNGPNVKGRIMRPANNFSSIKCSQDGQLPDHTAYMVCLSFQHSLL